MSKASNPNFNFKDPKNLQECFDSLKIITENINTYSQLNDHKNLVEYAIIKEQVFERTIKYLSEMQLDHLIEPMKQQRAKNLEMINDLKSKNWYFIYQSMKTEFDKAVQKNDIYAIKAKIKEILQFLDEKRHIITDQNEGMKIRELINKFQYTSRKFSIFSIVNKHQFIIEQYQRQKKYEEASKEYQILIIQCKNKLEEFKTAKDKEMIHFIENLISNYEEKFILNDYFSRYNNLETLFHAMVAKYKNKNDKAIRFQFPILFKGIETIKNRLDDLTNSKPIYQNLMNAADYLFEQTQKFSDAIQKNIDFVPEPIKVKQADAPSRTGGDSRSQPQPKQEQSLVTANKEVLPSENKALLQLDLATNDTFSLSSELSTTITAKAIVMGESSVGKTHLILSITNSTYSATQGSTIGIDKYFLKIPSPFEDFKTEVCFWDLGGQWNFRTMNDLFVNDASVVLLVYDMTRPETFRQLTFWIEMYKKSRNYDTDKIILVGNKSDVGGNAVPKEEIDEFIKKYMIKKHVLTSAKEFEEIDTLINFIIQTIKWESIFFKIDSRVLERFDNVIKGLRNQIKIMTKEDLMNILKIELETNNTILLNTCIKKYASQSTIQLSQSEQIVLMDPEFVSKWVGKFISHAANGDGKIVFNNYIKKWKLDIEQLKGIFGYLCDENICLELENGIYLFPNVIHQKEITITDELRTMLDFVDKSITYVLNGALDVIFSRLIVLLSRDIGPPSQCTNWIAVWLKKQGVKSSMVYLNYINAPEGGVIRVKTSGHQSDLYFEKTNAIIETLTKLYKSEITEIREG